MMKKSKMTFSPDVLENDIRTNMPHILEILLLDRTTSSPNVKKNIIWANDNYKFFNSRAYAETAQIKPELITNSKGSLIMPRALKTKGAQKERTRTKAEVFTPTWVVKKQNDVIDKSYKNDSLETYIRRKWLEIACGEAPYMTTRYNMETGELVPIAKREGFIDRKLARINEEVVDKAEWQRLVELAYLLMNWLKKAVKRQNHGLLKNTILKMVLIITGTLSKQTSISGLIPTCDNIIMMSRKEKCVHAR